MPETFKDGYPTVCVVCGKPVRMTGLEPLWFHTENGVRWSAHAACVQERGLMAITREKNPPS